MMFLMHLLELHLLQTWLLPQPSNSLHLQLLQIQAVAAAAAAAAVAAALAALAAAAAAHMCSHRWAVLHFPALPQRPHQLHASKHTSTSTSTYIGPLVRQMALH
jgi:hypothetical protein